MQTVVNKFGFSIGRRLALSLGLILCITSASAGYGIYHLGQLAQDSKQLSADSLALERDTQEWIGVATITGARSLIGARFADTESTNDTFTAFKIADPATNRARVTELVKNISAQIDTPEGRGLLADMVAKRKLYNDAQDAAKQLLADGKPKEAQAYAKATMQPALRGYVVAAGAVQEYARKTIAQREEATQARAASARTWVTVLTLLSVLLGATIGWLLTRRITTPLKQAVRVAEKVASGDLRTHIEVAGNDETGALLAAIAVMQDNLKTLIGEVQRDVGAVSSSASQLAVAANELSSSTASQNEAVSSTAASVEELTVSISQMSDSAQLAQDVVEATVKVSDAGLDMGNKVSREIGEIDRSVEDFAQQMQALQGQAGEIGTVVKLIKEIADQTNLLALNAAIEAARAGEQGRGFAVVADEVRKLAERTGSATNEIQKTIEAIQSNMGAAGHLLDNVKSRVETGVTTIADLIEPLKTLQSQAERAASGLRELTNATREQQQASEQIARNTERIASSAEENHASVSQSRDTSNELSALADRLMGSMTRFQV